MKYLIELQAPAHYRALGERCDELIRIVEGWVPPGADAMGWPASFQCSTLNVLAALKSELRHIEDTVERVPSETEKCKTCRSWWRLEGARGCCRLDPGQVFMVGRWPWSELDRLTVLPHKLQGDWCSRWRAGAVEA